MNTDEIIASPAFAARFWAKVNRTGDCWLWFGAKSKPVDGYGLIVVVRRPRQVNVLAHRASWQMVNGPLTAGMLVCHSCDTPLCVRPSHLFVGTTADNLADMRAKARGNIGERHGRARLTESDIRTILRRAGQGESNADIARDYLVRSNYINDVVERRAWRHVSRPPETP